MHNSKLFQLLRTLEASEFRWLYKFLKSPYHNSNPQYTRLFEYIKKYYPDLAHKKLAKEIVFKKLYPKEEFEPQKMRKLMHELAVLVEEFLVVHAIKNDPFQYRKTFIAELGKRNHYKAFEKETNILLNELEQEEQRSENHFLDRYQLRKQLFAHPLTLRGQESGDKVLIMSEELDNFFFLQKLKMASSLESSRRIYNIKNDLPFIDIVSESLNLKPQWEIPEIRVYASIHKMLKNRNDESLFKVAYDDFLNLERYLERNEKETCLNGLINYSTYHLNRGRKEYINYNFELYKIGIESQLFVKKGKISSKTFSNIISSGAFLKQFEWVKQFIEDYKNYLDIDERDELVSINKSNIAFKEGKFKTSIEYLSTVSFNKTLYKILARTLLLKSYFELFINDYTYFDFVLSQSETFEKFIRREKNISDTSKSSLLNLIKLVQKLIVEYEQEQDLRKIALEIEKTSPLSNKPWLLEKVRF